VNAHDADRSGDRRPGISIVVPVFRSKQSLPMLVDALDRELRKVGRPFEIVLVDDCSPDETWEVMRALKSEHAELKIVRLLRNSGQHNAILCGFSIANGEIIVTMDDDLQNPPEELPKLIAAIDQGFDLAIGAYDIKQHGSLRNLGGRLIDAVQRRIFGLPADFQLTSFRAVRRQVIENVVQMGGVFPYVTSMLLSHTSKYVNVPVHHAERKFGKSNYNLKRSGLLALNLMLSYSSYPLYLIIALCVVAFACSAGFGMWILWRALSEGFSVPGWASTVIISALFNGLILLALVIHGLYLSRLSRQLSRSQVSFTIGELHE
jgi:glycosyltransferase involved in cell wall biosynthesis